jgi:hypothetical protein
MSLAIAHSEPLTAELVNPLVIGGESGMDIPERGAE